MSGEGDGAGLNPALATLPAIPPRQPDGHKGTFGTVMVVGGHCDGGEVMLGGPALTALAALRTGCGLAWLALPRPILASALEVVPEATGIALPVDETDTIRPSAAAEAIDARLPRVQCCAVGPALGTSDQAAQLVLRLIANAPVPLVVDADALNGLSRTREFAHDFKAPAILTPHPGEFARLCGALGLPALSSDAGPQELAQAATRLAARLGCVVVLKGSLTTVADAIQPWQLHAGTAALATGGSGDVLTGVIASCVAQFHAASGLTLVDCARIGVALHGLAARRWTRRQGPAGMLARDLVDAIPAALESVRRHGWCAASSAPFPE
ncbi:MAG: NAD(P)H-hydrate dehydratase [Planctomycetota bacterium]|nr:NAD(P)H-hydrate dehydratase [Planctomycetota bacterium]MDA1105240.1 NAD(P)H-hydrate dehydratase [Planctomycetota bacterium]